MDAPPVQAGGVFLGAAAGPGARSAPGACGCLAEKGAAARERAGHRRAPFATGAQGRAGGSPDGVQARCRSAAAARASRPMRAQSPDLMASPGSIHEPPTQATFGSAR